MNPSVSLGVAPPASLIAATRSVAHPIGAERQDRTADRHGLPTGGRGSRDRDIVIRCCAEGRDPADVKARDLAQGSLYWVDAGTDITDVLSRMQQHQVKRMPVIEDHRLVGMISEADLARHLSESQVAHFVEDVYADSGFGQRAAAAQAPGSKPGGESMS